MHNRSLRKKVFYLVIVILAIFFTPYIAEYFQNTPHGIPKEFFAYPPSKPRDDHRPGPNLFFNIISSVVFIGIILFLIFPQWFGFKKHPKRLKAVNKVPFPIWFWIGLVLWVGTLLFSIVKFSEPKWLINWELIPLWWGFTLFLDGCVYHRMGGRSLIASEPTELIAMAVISVSGWFIFEYLNFFIKLNWYYPNTELMNHDEFMLYALLGSTAFIPMTFEWYYFLRSFHIFDNKYKNGPIRKFPTWLMILLLTLSIAGLFATPFHPNPLFFVLWLAPLIILSIALEMLGIWTPFTSIKQKGDWSALLVFAPTFLIQGLILECFNYLSGHNLWTLQVESFNPAYWVYCIPFVTDHKIFEMPILGYLGYIPFGIYCWIWWITAAFLMNISTNYSLHEDYR